MEKKLISAEQRILAEEKAKNAEIANMLATKFGIEVPEYKSKQPLTTTAQKEQKNMSTALVENKPKTRSKRRASIGMSRQDWKQVAFKMPADIYKVLDDILRDTPEHTLSSWALCAVREKIRRERVTSAIQVD